MKDVNKLNSVIALINALIKDNLWYDENTDISKVADELKDELADVIRHSFIA